ncbi:radial spoke head 10 homolog B isoform X1 [Gadus morhua]|uniref:Radial spoke head 10 homolog B n=2 Tax=Gadus morhua TaxID=8049 RepID=A0A8C4Z2U8_GADMO|nr:radial spoke head 10 homolog B isoform X1 [Gadus morhua]
MAKGERKNKTRKTSDATENKILIDSPAPSVSESPGVVLTTSELPQDKHVEDQQHTDEIHEPPAVSDIIVQRYEGETYKNKMHGEGVAHFQGGHVYKGAFSEGLIQGYGLFTWSDGVKYEGQFEANVPMGHGKYTWLDGSSYEGDIYNAIRHGIGAHRCANTPLLYRGQWHRGKRHGKGVVYYNQAETSWYDGHWKGNKREGWGARRYPSGNLYEGEWRDNGRHGEGTMKWLTLGEQYVGTWSNGVQHGQGTHTWFVWRMPGSQYPRRNEYQGAFVLGQRHGQGTFFYASGECYQGEWRKNEKHGRGKFTFTNGRSVEREFVDDHMLEFPPWGLDGSTSPHTDHPPRGGPTHRLPGQGFSSMLGPYMELDIDFLLEKFPASIRPSEHKQVEFVVLRHVSELRSIYSFYSSLGHAESPDNVFLLSRLQYWRLLLDCKVHHHGCSLAQLDRLVPGELLSPYTGILLPSLISSLVSVAYHTFHKALGSQKNILAECFSKLMQDNVLPNAKIVKGFLFSNVERVHIAMRYMENCWRIYQAMSKDSPTASPGLTMTCRQLLLMFKDLKVLDTKLTARKLLEVYTAVNQDPSNLSYCNMEQEVTFLEFFEVLLGCADVKRDEEARDQPPQPGPASSPPNQRASLAGDSPPPTTTHLSQTDAAKVKCLEGTEESSSKSEMEKSMEALNSSSFEKSEVGVKDHTTDLSTVSELSVQQGTHPDDQVSSACISVSMQQASALESESFPLNLSEATRQTGVVEKEAEESELDMWIQRTHLFFSQLFFPAYEHCQRLDQEVQDERCRQKAQQRIALAKAQERARQIKELKAEEEERRRREEEKRRREEEEDELTGPSPGALTPVGSSSSLAPTATGKKNKQLISKEAL